MLHELDQRRDPRGVLFFHSVRDGVNRPFEREVAQLQARAGDQGRRLDVHTRFTRSAPSGSTARRLTAPQVLGELRASGLLPSQALDVDVLLCGPPTMVQKLAQELEEAGIDARSIRSESF